MSNEMVRGSERSYGHDIHAASQGAGPSGASLSAPATAAPAPSTAAPAPSLARKAYKNEWEAKFGTCVELVNAILGGGYKEIMGIPFDGTMHRTPEVCKAAMNSRMYHALLGMVPASPITDQDEHNGLLIYFGDGTNRDDADLLPTFEALYGTGVLVKSGDPAPEHGHTVGASQWWRFPPLDPTAETMKKLLNVVRTLPQGHVKRGKIAFASKEQTMQLVGGVENVISTRNLNTSLFIDSNSSIIRATDVGVKQAERDQSIFGNANDVAGGVLNRSGIRQGAEIFVNHVRHEVGHAVGENRFAGMAQSGNEFAHHYAGWRHMTEAEVQNSTAHLQAGHKDIDTAGLAGRVTAQEVFEWVEQCFSRQTEVRGNPISRAGGDVESKLASVRAAQDVDGHSVDEDLLGYAAAIAGTTHGNLGRFQDRGYVYRTHVPRNDPIIWSSRMSPRGWYTYSRDAYAHLHDDVSWYSLSSEGEMFAELYTHRYSGGQLPAPVNRHDPKQFFKDLEASADTALKPSNDAAGIDIEQL